MTLFVQSTSANRKLRRGSDMLVADLGAAVRVAPAAGAGAGAGAGTGRVKAVKRAPAPRDAVGDTMDGAPGQLVPVDAKATASDVCQAAGVRYVVGACYYELSKVWAQATHVQHAHPQAAAACMCGISLVPTGCDACLQSMACSPWCGFAQKENISATKLLWAYSPDAGWVDGAAARRLIKAPAKGATKLGPKDLPPGVVLYVQSTSVTRKLAPGTKLLVVGGKRGASKKKKGANGCINWQQFENIEEAEEMAVVMATAPGASYCDEPVPEDDVKITVKHLRTCVKGAQGSWVGPATVRGPEGGPVWSNVLWSDATAPHAYGMLDNAVRAGYSHAVSRRGTSHSPLARGQRRGSRACVREGRGVLAVVHDRCRFPGRMRRCHRGAQRTPVHLLQHVPVSHTAHSPSTPSDAHTPTPGAGEREAIVLAIHLVPAVAPGPSSCTWLCVRVQPLR